MEMIQYLYIFQYCSLLYTVKIGDIFMCEHKSGMSVNTGKMTSISYVAYVCGYVQHR